MTPKDRVHAALNHEEVDFAPVYAFVENNALYEHFAPGETDLMKAAAVVHRALQVDVTYLVRRAPSAADEARSRAGGAAPGTHVSGMTVWADKPFKTMADLEAWRPTEPSPEPGVRAALAEYEAEKAALEPDTVVIRQGGGFLVYYHTGLELFSYALHDRPALLEAMIENTYEQQREHIRGLCAHRPGPAYQICEDLAYRNGLLFPPGFLRRVYFPRLAELVEIIHGFGMKVIQHTDGDVTEVLDDLVGAGIDGLNPLEGMDLAAVKKRYGRNLVLVGNVDSRVLAFGTPEDVRRAVRGNIRAGWGQGGHWLDTSAGEFMPDVPLENALAYFAAAKEPRLREGQAAGRSPPGKGDRAMRRRPTWGEKLRQPHPSHGKVVEVPPKMQPRFGPGTMLIPRPLDLDALVRAIPPGKLTTVPRLMERLARDAGADYACPMTTGIFLRIVAEAAEEDRTAGEAEVTPYWRVLKHDGSLNEKYPGGVEAQAARLAAEGHAIEPGRGSRPPRVKEFAGSLQEG